MRGGGREEVREGGRKGRNEETRKGGRDCGKKIT